LLAVPGSLDEVWLTVGGDGRGKSQWGLLLLHELLYWHLD
jgi:hypothetical protein